MPVRCRSQGAFKAFNAAGTDRFSIYPVIAGETDGRARQSVTREERHNAQLAAVVAASDDAIISLGTDFVVQTWNAGAQRMFGYGEAEARGVRSAN